MSLGAQAVEVGLNAAIVSVAGAAPRILIAPKGDGGEDGLPFGPFDPLNHRTFETGLRSWVGEQTGLSLGYVEQLYTFGDRGRHRMAGDRGPHVVSVGYLALTRPDAQEDEAFAATGARWQPFYRYLPWEDWREGRPPMIDELIVPALAAFSPSPASGPSRPGAWTDRLSVAFGQDGVGWDEERALDRYEMLYEAGLVEEAARDGRAAGAGCDRLGTPMRFDHRRILATAIARLRAKLKYRPVIFELLPAEFTLSELQKAAEAIAGRPVHKQNFRRFVENTGLVEPTGGVSAATGGRPAALFRFRPEVTRERPSPGIRFGRA
ncbi:NUDIX hydrolase [Aureimonas populi]|uniref:NAD regulator n=1 Tax=Aureimonas populi TaxID=1701758 RepID=A0ABW5CMX5_9HYPH|nr:NAD regulator [Aureimonas populi]